jgi:lysine 2,3-aminomutase
VRDAVRTHDELAAYLRERGIVPAPVLATLADPQHPTPITHHLPLRVPRYYLDLIDFADLADPLRRQVLPTADEWAVHPDELADPIGDDAHSPTPGVVHRYPDRALLLLTAACAVHCRFCFRREFVGQPARALSAPQLEAAYDYLARQDEIWEVILSGGDVLTLPDTFLAGALERLRAIPHVRIVRIHSRVPAVLPARLTDELAALLRRHAPVYLVAHVNHPREVTPAFVAAVGRLVDAGTPVLSQSVLMRGVNDDAGTLADLFRRLVEARVKPYYLHHPDLARGTGHFRVSIATGRRLMRELRGRVSGLCLPTYVLDTPGGLGKVPLEGAYVHHAGGDDYEVEAALGARARYVDVASPTDQ